jgi:hypothetical protein
MTHSEAAALATLKYPIHEKDIPEQGIKKTCRLDRMLIERAREAYADKLLTGKIQLDNTIKDE